MDSIWNYAPYLLIPLAGLAAGFINAMAGSGSMLTLPALMLGGLTSSMANGTNRIGILLQSLTSYGAYRRKGVRGFAPVLWLTLPAIAGGLAGALTAVSISSEWLDRVIAVAMLGMGALMLLDTSRWHRPVQPVQRGMLRNPWLWVAFLAIGFYGGFVQVGSNFFILLALVYLGRMDLLHANGFKLVVQLSFTVTALPVYIFHGLVDWPLALLLSAGTMLGAWLGVHAAVRIGVRFVQYVIVVIVVVFALKLLFW